MVKLNFSNVIGRFGQMVLVYDYESSYNDTGIWQEVFVDKRLVPGIVLLLSVEQLQLLQQGEQSTNGISFIVKKNLELYFNDNQNPEQSGKQSYISVGGYIYRVIGSHMLENNTQQKIYTALRVVRKDIEYAVDNK